MKKFRVVVNDTEYVVAVEELAEGAVSAAPSAAPSPAPTAAPPAPSTPAAPAAAVDPVVAEGDTPVDAPLNGTILKVMVSEGATVNEGDVLLTLEALKLENEITAPVSGVVSQLFVKQGDAVEPGDILATLRSES